MTAGENQASWCEAELANICSKPQYGYTTKASSKGSVKFLRTTDITKGSIRWNDVPFCETTPENVKKYQLENRDIVISRAGSIGFSSLLIGPPEKSVFASYLIRFKPSKQFSERFLKRFLESHGYWSQLASMSAGNAVQNVNAQKLSMLIVPVAPLAEQKVIAGKLDTLLAQVENTEARLERIPQILKRFRQSVLAAAVSGRLTEEWRGAKELIGWKESELGQFVEKPRYGTSAKSQKTGDTPVLRMGNLQDGQLNWTHLVFTSDQEEIKKYRLEPGDVLFNRTNSPELVGKTSIFRGEREAIYAGYLIKIKCLPSLSSEFLNYQLNSPKAKDYCKAVKSDGVSQSNINAKKLAAYPLNCPPLEEQAEIVRRVDQLFVQAERIEQQVNNALDRVNNLTHSILAKAFRGELTEQWRKDNPELISGENSAEVLLERIKAERAAMKKPAKKTYKQTTA